MYWILSILALGTASFTGTYGFVLPRQDPISITVSPPPTVVSTSSFNWWPYPPGGVVSSTSTPTAILIPTTTTNSVSSSVQSSSSTSSDLPTSTLLSSVTPITSLIQVTALTFLPASASPSSGPPTPYRPHGHPFNKLFLIPLCILAGAVVGFALAWAGWRIKEQRSRAMAGAAGYAWAYHGRQETDAKDRLASEKGVYPDMEGGHASPVLGLGPVRMPSHASTSGAQTWVARAQARKRSGASGLRLPSASRARGWGHVHDGEEIAASPLLGSASDAEPELESTPVPASSLPSPYPYGDEDEGEADVRHESVPHKSIRQRILERLGLTEVNIENNQHGANDATSGNSQNARENERVNVERRASLWGHTKSQKKKVERVEQWVWEVEHEVDDESTKCEMEEAPLQRNESHLDLRTLRRVSPVHTLSSKYGHVNSDAELPAVPSSHAKDPTFYSSSPGRDMAPFPVPISDSRSAKTLGTQRKGSRILEGSSRGVSLQDTGIAAGPRGSSRFSSKKLPPPPKDASPPCSKASTRKSLSQKDSQRVSSSPSTASSASRYSATPRTAAPAKSVDRTPNHALTCPERAPALDVALPSRATAAKAPSRSCVDSSTRFIPIAQPARTRPPSLPAGPPLLMSPPLQAELAFGDAPGTPPALMRGPRVLPSTVQTRNNLRGRTRPPKTSIIASGVHLPSHGSQDAATKSSRSPSPSSRPLSPKERYLARQGANNRVGMILSRSYSSRNFTEDVNSPNMFGAVIDAHVMQPHLDEDEVVEGIEQRLERVRYER